MIPIIHLLQNIEQHPSILIVLKNRSPSIPPGGDMINSLSILNPQRSRHTMLLNPSTSNINIKDLTPFLSYKHIQESKIMSWK